jgi:NADP-dependent alcohol dehydrogenase
MTAAWTGATRWLAGEGAVEQALRQATIGPRPALVFDAGAAATPAGAALLDRVRAALPAPPAAERPVTRPATVAELAALQADWSQGGITAAVAVGGGCTLDVAVLAALPPAVLASPRLARGHCGLVLLTPATRPTRPTVAIPTTLGTGAEVSAAACCERPGDGRLLVLGDALRPAHAAVDPAATAGLPVRLVREALVEILARILVPFAFRPSGPAPVVDLSDGLALANLRRLVTVAGRMADSDLRLAVATVSAHSHAGWGSVGRASHASPMWPVGTELATLTGWTKATAHGYLLPAWASAVAGGDDRWGDASRLRTAWRAVIEADAGLDPDPAPGLAGLVDRWIGPSAASADVAAAVGERAHRRWGAGLPMLGRFAPSEIAELVRASRRPDPVAVAR